MFDCIPTDEVKGKSNRPVKKGTEMQLFTFLFWTQEQEHVMEYSKCIMPRVLQNILKVQQKCFHVDWKLIMGA